MMDKVLDERLMKKNKMNYGVEWSMKKNKKKQKESNYFDYTTTNGGSDWIKYCVDIKNVQIRFPAHMGYYKVIFNPPATIVFWVDGTKTIVKCSENDIYDREKGLALCFMKKALGNSSGVFHKILKKEINKEEKTNESRNGS